MTSVTCPTCGKLFDPAESPAMPFCSARCRSIDLNRWLKEEIALPYREADESDRSELDDAPDDE